MAEVITMCKDPFNQYYLHQALHHQCYSPQNTALVPLYPEEEAYFKQKGFAVVYKTDLACATSLPQKEVDYPFIFMSEKSDYLARGNLRVITSRISERLHASPWHPSVIPLDRLVNAVEHDILSNGKYFNKKEEPISIYVEDSAWHSVIAALKDKYQNLQEYNIKQPNETP